MFYLFLLSPDAKPAPSDTATPSPPSTQSRSRHRIYPATAEERPHSPSTMAQQFIDGDVIAGVRNGPHARLLELLNQSIPAIDYGPAKCNQNVSDTRLTITKAGSVDALIISVVSKTGGTRMGHPGAVRGRAAGAEGPCAWWKRGAGHLRTPRRFMNDTQACKG